MKNTRKIIPALLPALAFGLFGCAESIEPKPLFTVNFFNDFSGIDYTNLPVSPSVDDKVGVGYGYTGETVLFTKTDDTFDYVSTQTPATGHKFVFDKWVGQYPLAEGAESREAVDLNSIKGDCSVFAKYIDQLETYRVQFFDHDGKTIIDEYLEYGASLSALDIPETMPSLAPSHYYIESHPFLGWKITHVGGSELPDKIKNVFSAADLDAFIVDNSFKFVALYDTATPYVSYEVKFVMSDGTTAMPLGGSDKETVTYDNPVTKTPTVSDDTKLTAAATGKSYEFAGWEGTYSSDADIPSEVRGRAVDANHIRYNCTLKPKWNLVDDEVTVTFKGVGAGGADYTMTVPYGSKVVYDGPATTAPSGSVFAGWVDSEGIDFVSLNYVTEDVTVYPIYTIESATIQVDTGDQPKKAFRFNFDTKGYDIVSYAPVCHTEVQLKSGGNPLNQDDYETVTVLDSESTVNVGKYVEEFISSCNIATIFKVNGVASRAFANLPLIERIRLHTCHDIIRIGDKAFAGCDDLTTINLPSDPQYMGSRVFDALPELDKIFFNSGYSTEILAMYEEAGSYAADWDATSVVDQVILDHCRFGV